MFARKTRPTIPMTHLPNHSQEQEKSQIKTVETKSFISFPWKLGFTMPLHSFFNKQSYSGYIAVIDPFHGRKTAELEFIKRLETACYKINVGLFIVYGDRIQNTELKGMSLQDLDSTELLFVLALHYNTMKTTRHKTLMVLWNPLEFHTEKAWKNVLSMDGFLSAYSDIIDEEVQRRTSNPFYGHLTTTLSDPILDITLLDNPKPTCFYVGNNWENQKNPNFIFSEIITNNRVKVLELVRRLNDEKLVSIYGPKDAWTDYSCYVGELEYDGKSIIHEIHKCGICLVLSSDAHIKDEVCSNRLFEGLAAGVPIITDENPFMRKWFGNCLFYIDNTCIETAYQQIQQHLEFFKSNPEETINKIRLSRYIFFQHFLLDKQLQNIVSKV